MTDETRKDQEKKDELTEKDLDKASGGGHTESADGRASAEHRQESDKRQASGQR